jgi:hypothetical protein
MSSIDSTKKIYLIVHGQRHLLEQIKAKLTASNFKPENMLPASMDKAGEIGEYVAMLWPPMAPKEIVLSQIIGFGNQGGLGMGAWSSVSQKEVMRMPLA